MLDGSNNEPVPKKGRKFVGSMTSLKKEENRMYRGVSQNTIEGILSLLIGDRRKLYQAKCDPEYFFNDMQLEFTDETTETEELVYVRNLTGNYDQNSYCGLLNDMHPIFTSTYSASLWSILFMDIDEVLAFINTGIYMQPSSAPSTFDPLMIAERFDELNKLKDHVPAEIPEWVSAISALSAYFPDVEYSLTSGGKFRPVAFYCSAMYLMIDKLSQAHDLSSVLTKQGFLSGISKRSFSRSDFFSPFSNGKRLAHGNPYMSVQRIKGIGEQVNKMITACGTLTVRINGPKEKIIALPKMIENAGIGCFRVGKKGLAYVASIDSNVEIQQ